MSVCVRVALMLTVLLHGYHMTSLCDDDTLEQCVAEYNEFLSQLDSDAFRDEASILEQCDLLVDMEQCLDGILDDCSRRWRSIIEGQLNAHRYLCDHVNVFVAHQECFISVELLEQIDNCIHTTEDYEDATDNELCSYAIHDLECVRTQTLQMCGSEEAADFRYNYEMENLLPILMLIECDLNPTRVTHTYYVDTTTSGGLDLGDATTLSNTQSKSAEGLNSFLFIGLSIGAVALFLIITPSLIYVTCKVYTRRKRERCATREQLRKLSRTPNIPTVAAIIKTEAETPRYSPTYRSPEAVYATIDEVEPQPPVYTTLVPEAPTPSAPANQNIRKAYY